MLPEVIKLNVIIRGRVVCTVSEKEPVDCTIAGYNVTSMNSSALFESYAKVYINKLINETQTDCFVYFSNEDHRSDTASPALFSAPMTIIFNFTRITSDEPGVGDPEYPKNVMFRFDDYTIASDTTLLSDAQDWLAHQAGGSAFVTWSKYRLTDITFVGRGSVTTP